MTRPEAENDLRHGKQGKPVFVGRGLTKIYVSGEVEVRALDGVDVDLYPGELIVLLGPSGSGKSTLLNNLGGLDVPTAGTLTYRGRDIADADEDALTDFRRNAVGFVFQFYNLIPSLTARENVALITEIAPDPMTPEEALALVDLSDRMDHFPSQMSGGQQQRAAIARALAMNPQVMLYDEPTSALDPELVAEVLSVMKQLDAEGMTQIVVTHEMRFARDASDYIVFMEGGKIVEVSDEDEIFENPKDERTRRFLGRFQ